MSICILALPASGTDAAKELELLSGFLQDFPLPSKELRVLEVQGEFWRTEKAVEALWNRFDAQDVVLLPGSYAGKEMATRLAAKCQGTAATDVTSMTKTESGMEVTHSLCAEHLTGTFRLHQGPFFLSIYKNYSQKEAIGLSGSHEIERIFLDFDPLTPKARKVLPGNTDSGLSTSPLVIAGGRGLGSKEDAEFAAATARELGASFGASRPVVMNAWRPMEELLGVSGTMIHPDVCLVLGASGSPAFYAGISASKTIIAVNQDSKAPINKKSDVYITADWKEFLKLLVKNRT